MFGNSGPILAQVFFFSILYVFIGFFVGGILSNKHWKTGEIVNDQEFLMLALYWPITLTIAAIRLAVKCVIAGCVELYKLAKRPL